MKKYEEEMQAVVKWLEHPNELGKTPATIEFVKEFKDEENINCLIFRFREEENSPWLMAINSDSGIFSECEEYDEENDIAQATAMVEYLKAYWKSVARSEEDKEKRKKNAAPFLAFVLKKEAKFEPDLFVKMYEEDWDEKLKDVTNIDGDLKKGTSVDTKLFEDEYGLTLMMGHMPFPIPNDEAVYCARNNFMWPEGADIVAPHKAHTMIMISGGDEAVDRADFYSRVLATYSRMENSLGIDANNVVYDLKMVDAICHNALDDDRLPTPVLVWVGLVNDKNGISAFTVGMDRFGFDEMEVHNCNMSAKKLQSMLYYLIDYCIESDTAFYDGDNIPFTAGVTIGVTKSKGELIKEDGETLKLVFNEE